MSTTVNIKADVTRILDANQPSAVLTPSATTSIDDSERTAVVSFESIPVANTYNAVESVTLGIRPNGAAQMEVAALTDPFDPNTICYDDYPSTGGSTLNLYSNGTVWLSGALDVMDSLAEYSPGIRAINNGLLLRSSGESLTFYTSVAASASRPYLRIVFGSDVHLEPTGYPTQGYVDKNADLTLQWSNEVSGGVPAVVPSQTHAELHWQMSGGLDNQVDLSNEQNYTIPAGTLGSGTVLWYVEITDSTGAVHTTPQYSLTTVEPLSTATALAPKNTTVDAADGIDFSWKHTIATGTLPTGADIDISNDGITWTTLAQVTGSATTYHAAPGTVLSGTHYWRVRTYNQDGNAGSWSTSVTFAAIAPPLAPSVMATSESRPTVSWTATEQQAYEIQIDSVSYGPFFGTDTSWRSVTYLENGSHNAKVRVQNAYGLWSAWGIWTFTVNNSTTPTITLTAVAGESPDLSWTSTASPVPDAWLVYRDGELIAKTTTMSYRDTGAAAGTHTYLVRGIYDADGTYAISHPVQAAAVITGAVIMDALTGTILSCPTVLETDRVIRETQSINVAFVHYAGAVWPVAEGTVARTNSYNFAPTWPRGQAPDVLSLLGREVLVRDQYGGKVYGVLIRITPETRQTRVRISMQIQQTAEPEVVL